MIPEHEFFIPFTIPLWGVVETDHTHLGSHLNFVFHADEGKITGAAAYPGMSGHFSYRGTFSITAIYAN